MKPIALQLYTVRHALAADPTGTLRRVREAGFNFVETAPLPPELKTSTLAKILAEEELTVVSAHCDLPLGERQNQVLDDAAILGTQRIVWHGWPKSSECESVDRFEILRDRYLTAYQAARSRGLQFGLHNHWWEFEPTGNVYLYNWLNRHLPQDLFFQLDVYWVQTAGLNPVKILAELGDRIQMVHLKDGPAIHGQPMTALGEGAVDIRSIFNASQAAQAWVVELDECATDPVAAAERSLQYLKTILSKPSPSS
jgi:sugar phosphate isomerase/epimerase